MSVNTLQLASVELGVIQLSVEWVVVGPGWGEALFSVATEALRGSPALALTSDPPSWDVDPGEVSARVSVHTLDGYRELLLPFDSADSAALQAAVDSTDFRLGTLLLTALPTDDLGRIEALLVAVHSAASARPPATTELLLHCSDDARFYAHNLSTDALARVKAALGALTEAMGWRLRDLTTKENH